MASVMGCKRALLWLCFIGITNASLELTGKWIQNFGWELTCSWHTDKNDSLQSVRLFRNERQFMIHRTEINGLHQELEEMSPEFRLKVSCRLEDPRGQAGRCVITIELFRPTIAMTDLYRCEVSGERPTFKLESQEYEAFVQPSDTKVKEVPSQNGQNYLNCTSEGLPPPQLIWKTKEGQKVPETFRSASWNSYRKLWLSWSTVKVEGSSLECSAQLPLRNGTVIVAGSKNSASLLRQGSGGYFVLIYVITHFVAASQITSVFLSR